MAKSNGIVLYITYTNKMAEKKNELPENYSIFYQNTPDYQRNIKGEKFFELHPKFEELFSYFLIKIVEVAERILTLAFPKHIILLILIKQLQSWKARK